MTADIVGQFIFLVVSTYTDDDTTLRYYRRAKCLFF